MEFECIVAIFLVCAYPIRTGSGQEVPMVSISFPQDLADVDFQNASLAVMSNSYPAFDLDCNASYPIEWIMFFDEDDDGISEKKIAETRRNVSDFQNSSSYIYSARLSLQYTGKIYVFANFSCKAVGNSELQTHVITTSANRRSVIFLSITSDKKYIRTTADNVTKSKKCPAFAYVSDMTKDSSCWRCEKADGTRSELEIDFIGCKSPIQCNSYYQRHNQRKDCLKLLKNRPENETCKQIGGRDYSPKIFVCKNFGPVLAQFYYFGVPRMGKAPKMFFDWSEIDPQQMMYMYPVQDQLYYGQNLTITCEMSKYYFSYGSWFGIENVSSQLNGITVKSYIKNDDEDADDWKGSFASTLNLTLVFPAPSRIFCFAPVWNSTEWINSSVELNVQYGDKPRVVSMLADNSEKFDIGQKTRSILCIFSGKPSPDVKWFGPIGSYYKVETNNSNNISELVFPEITYASNGKYRCTVSVSFLGSDAQEFDVQIRSMSSSTLLKTSLAFGGVFLVIVAMIVGFVVVRLWRIVKVQREALRLLTEAEIIKFVEGDPDFVSKNEYFDSTLVMDALPYDKKYEIPQDKFHIDYSLLLGSGAFGKVYKGKVDTENCSHYVNVRKSADNYLSNYTWDSLEVAIKTCDTDVDVLYFKAILSEIKVMAYIGHHKNIVGLVGACTKNIRNREVYIALEFCPHGSLMSFSRDHRDSFVNIVEYGIMKLDEDLCLSGRSSYGNTEWAKEYVLSTKDLFTWSYDIAIGMEYLHEKKVIHGDLATRNVLLTIDMVAKISDFGLARQLVECSNYVKKTQGPLPWRYLAPESLRDLEFSVKSDIWAFGVTLWEVFTLSEVPYPGIAWSSDFLSQLQNGHRLAKPVYATNDIYEFMLKCWKLDSEERPDFSEIKSLCSNSLHLLIPKKAQSQDYFKLCDNENAAPETPGGDDPLVLNPYIMT